ncbi:MAG: hypothetical protein N3A59_06260 [Thermodesulfovibrionales bacterium]|nr:hypothetical protein [Thermodesulfovibrionales bacterium]
MKRFLKQMDIKEKKDKIRIRFNDLLLQGLNIGAIIGIIVFAFVGLMPSSFFSETIGTKIASYFSSIDLVPRIFAPVIMIIGLMAIGVTCIAGASLVAGLLNNYKICSFKKFRFKSKLIFNIGGRND